LSKNNCPEKNLRGARAKKCEQHPPENNIEKGGRKKEDSKEKGG